MLTGGKMKPNKYARARFESGMKQAEFAKTLGIKQPTLSDIESGKSTPAEPVEILFNVLYGEKNG